MLNASPTSAAQPSRLSSLPEPIARSPTPQARIISRIRSASRPLSRETATNEGNTASASALMTPAAGPNLGVTTQYSAPTASTPMIASGSSRLSG